MSSICGALAACTALASTANAEPPAAFAICAACHSSDGTNGVGPSLKDVYGRKAGTAKGFAYSPAMKKSEVTWDDATLDDFIGSPQKSMPGNRMPYPGVA
jgi:cytochrome c